MALWILYFYSIIIQSYNTASFRHDEISILWFWGGVHTLRPIFERAVRIEFSSASTEYKFLFCAHWFSLTHSVDNTIFIHAASPYTYAKSNV